jgi:hypothetical protein
VHLRHETSMRYFSCSAGYGYDKNRTKTCYVELVFLHLMGSVGHVLHYRVSGA